MPTIVESIVIARPRQEVWDLCMNVENTPRWNPLFIEQELVDADRIEVGTQIRSVARIAGRRVVAIAEMTELDPPYRSTLRSDRPIPVVGSYVFEEVAEGTHFTWQMIAEPGLGGAFGVLADGLVIRIARWQLRRGLRRLRELAEAASLAADQTPG